MMTNCLLLADVDNGYYPDVLPSEAAVLPIGCCAFLFALFVFLLLRERRSLRRISLWIRGSLALVLVSVFIITASLSRETLPFQSDDVLLASFFTGFALFVSEVLLIPWCAFKRRFYEITYHVLVLLMLSSALLTAVAQSPQ